MNEELDLSDRTLYSISVVTELTGVSQQALRGYEEKGLVTPHRTGGGTRRYSRDDIDHITEIARLLESGLNHEGVVQVLSSRPRPMGFVRAQGSHRRRDLAPRVFSAVSGSGLKEADFTSEQTKFAGLQQKCAPPFRLSLFSRCPRCRRDASTPEGGP